MLKRSLAVMVVLVMILSFSSMTAFAEGKTYEAVKGTPVIDGVMDDIWLKATEADMPNTPIEGTEDYPLGDAKWRAMWDDTHVYVWAEVEDIAMFADDVDGAKHKEDSFVVYIEEDNGKDSYTEGVDKDNAVNTDGEMDTYYDENVDNWVCKVIKTEGKGYVVEAAATLVSIKGEEGKTIGFDVSLNDLEYIESAEYWERTGQRFWNDMTDQAWQNPAVLGNLKMVATPAEAPADDTDSDSDSDATGSDDKDLPDTGSNVTVIYAVAVLMLATGIFTVVRRNLAAQK